MKRKIVVIAIIIGAILIACGSVYMFIIRMYFDSRMPRQGIHEMVADFEENRETLLTVRDYFAELEYEWLAYPFGRSERGVMFAESALNLRFEIDNEHAGNAIRELLHRGYSRIEKRGGVISFIRWGNTNAGVGIVYSADGYYPHSGIVQFMTRLEPLAENGWFYFEVNYNEYRTTPVQGLYDMKIDFANDNDTVFFVRDYFLGLEYIRVSYPTTSGRHDVFIKQPYWHLAPIGDEDAKEAMSLLLRQGYRQIQKEDKFVILRRWGHRDAGVGVVYSVDRSIPDSHIIPYLIMLEPSVKDGWFYFESNHRLYNRD